MSNNTNLNSILDEKNTAFAREDFKAARRLADTLFSDAKRASTVTRKPKRECDVSIVIVSHRSNERTFALLVATNDWKFPFSHEVLIVINNDEILRKNITNISKTATIIDCPINLGCSGGRNLACHFSKGKYIIFIDDDGWTDANSLIALYKTCRQFNAIGVRGRVVPFPGSTSSRPPHYEPGASLLPSFMDAEGISIWNALQLKEAGGFDPLLAGHEGLELYSKLVRIYGPNAFLYTPDATLIHDFDDERKPIGEKLKRYEHNEKYLAYLGVQKQNLMSSIIKYRSSPDQRAVFLSSLTYVIFHPIKNDRFVSILTVAKNVEGVLPEYFMALQKQSYVNFEVVFVDDHSEDDTEKLLRDFSRNDSRIKVLKNEGSGRGAALNTSLKNASGEICIILDAEDLMVPSRLEWTIRYFEDHPDSACVSFYSFNDDSAFIATGPTVASPTSIRLRSFLGMPVSFSAFAFSKGRFKLPFKETLEAGVECDWVFKNLAKYADIDGHFLPAVSTYHRMPSSSINSNYANTEAELTFENVKKMHSEFLHFDEEKDKLTLLNLLGMRNCTLSDIQNVYNYIFKYNDNDQEYEAMSILRDFMLRRAKELHLECLAASPPPPILESREQTYDYAHDKWWKRTLPFRRLSNRIRKLQGKKPKAWPDLEK
jgi:glycosyltransferase involved in cell wall biosynthesis